MQEFIKPETLWPQKVWWCLFPSAPSWDDGPSGFELLLVKVKQHGPSLATDCREPSRIWQLHISSHNAFVLPCVFSYFASTRITICLKKGLRYYVNRKKQHKLFLFPYSQTYHKHSLGIEFIQKKCLALDWVRHSMGDLWPRRLFPLKFPAFVVSPPITFIPIHRKAAEMAALLVLDSCVKEDSLLSTGHFVPFIHLIISNTPCLYH